MSLPTKKGQKPPAHSLFKPSIRFPFHKRVYELPQAEMSDAKDSEQLCEYGGRLCEGKDKSRHVEDYENIIEAAKSKSIKSRRLAAHLIPGFFKFFPGLSDKAVDSHLDLCEAEELGIDVSWKYEDDKREKKGFGKGYEQGYVGLIQLKAIFS